MICTCTWRTSPPHALTFATPATPSSRGVITQSAVVRNCIGVNLSERSPIVSRSPVDEVSGVITGA